MEKTAASLPWKTRQMPRVSHFSHSHDDWDVGPNEMITVGPNQVDKASETG